MTVKHDSKLITALLGGENMANLETSALSFRTDLMLLVKNIVWYNHYEASKYEHYSDSSVTGEYVWAAQRLMEEYSTSQIKQIIEYSDAKFEALLQTADSVYKKPLRIVREYVEYNDYYRILYGLPPLHADQYETDEDYGIKLSTLGLTYDLILRLGIEDIYYTAYLHELTTAQLTFLEAKGYIRRLQGMHSGDKHYDYLQYMTTKKIFPFVARIAAPFDLLYVPPTKIPNLSNDFMVLYQKSRDFMIRRYYTDAYRNKYEYYEGFVGLAILFMTIQQLNVTYLDTDITREFYDLDSIRVVYRAYSVPFYEDIPVAFHAKIVKAINRLLTYKGSNHIIFDLAALFDYGKLTIFQYYLMRQQNINQDGSPHYIYDEIYDDDGNYLESEINYEKSFEVFFVKRALGEESPVEAIRNPNNDLDYQAVILDDHYWLDDADLREKMFQSEYNFIETKYIGLQTQISMTKYMYETVYFMRMLFDNKEIFERLTIHNSKIGEEVPIFTTIIYLHALICKKLEWLDNFNRHAVPGVEYLEGESRCSTCYGVIPTEPTKIAKLMGFDFKADLQKIIYDVMVMDSRHTISFLDENGNGWYFYPTPRRKGSKWVGMDVLVYEMRDNVIIGQSTTIEDFTPSQDTINKVILLIIEGSLPNDFRYRPGVISTEDHHAIVFVDPEAEYLLYDEKGDKISQLLIADTVLDAMDIFHNPVDVTPYTEYSADAETMYELIFKPINYDVHAASNDDDPAQPHELRSMGFGLNFMAREIVLSYLIDSLGYTPSVAEGLFHTHTLRVKDASIDMFDNSFDKITFIELLNSIDLESAVSVNSVLGITSTYRGIIKIREYIENRMLAVKDKDAFLAYKHLYKILMTCDILPDIITKNAYKKEVVYATDENGDIIYDTNLDGEQIPRVLEYRKIPEYEVDEDGHTVLDDNGNPVVKRDANGSIVYQHEVATSYADLLEDLDYGLAVRLMGLESDYDLGVEIDYILVEIQRLCDDLVYINSYGSFNKEVIVEYLYKLIKFFKSVKAQFLDFNIIYVIDSRTDNLLKLMTEMEVGYKLSDLADDKSLAIAMFDMVNKAYDLHIVDETFTPRDILLQFIMLMQLKSLLFKKEGISLAMLKATAKEFITIFEFLENSEKLTVLAKELGDMVNQIELVEGVREHRKANIKSICLKLDKIAHIIQKILLDYAATIRFCEEITVFPVSRVEDKRFELTTNIPHITMTVGPAEPNDVKWWGYMLWNNLLDVFHDKSYGQSEGVLSTEDDHALTFDELEVDGPEGEDSWINMLFEETDEVINVRELNGEVYTPGDNLLDIFHLDSNGKGVGVFATEDELALHFADKEPLAPYETLIFVDKFRGKRSSWGMFANNVYTCYMKLMHTGSITLEDMFDFFSIRKINEDLTLKDSLILDKYKIRYPDFGFAVPDDRTTENQVAVITTEDEEIISDTATNYYGNWEEGTPFERRE